MNEHELRRCLLDQLRSWSLSGIETLPRGDAERVAMLEWAPAPADTPPATPPVVPPSAPVVVEDTGRLAAPANLATPAMDLPASAKLLEPVEATGPYGKGLGLADRREVFRILSEEVAQCRRCAELVASRTQTVFGVGDLQPRVVFMGEAPGADEDRQGEPFVGAAGQLLNKIITASRLKREEVYILNALKCRPRNNRTPTDSEIATCRGFVERQLEILQPEFIVCLGGVATKSLLQEKRPVGHLRQQFFRYRGSRVLVTYHPSYLLREPSAKRAVWEDMQLLMREMDL